MLTIEKAMICLSFLLILSFVSGDDPVETYKCADELELNDVCYLSHSTSETTTTIYVKSCKKGNKCEYYSGTLSMCNKMKKLSEEGDKCVVDEECQSKKCTNNKCSTVSDGEECNFNDDACGLKSYCARYNEGKKCVAYAAEGASCEVTAEGIEQECRPGLVCGAIGVAETYTCSKQFSVDDGTEVSNQALCKSGEKSANPDNKCIPKTEKKAEFDLYVEEYIKEQGDVLKEDKKKLSDISKEVFNSKKLAELYVNYEYKTNIGTGDSSDCIRNYYIQTTLSSSNSTMNAFIVLVLIIILL